MDMHIIIGGAYSGKRQFVRNKWSNAKWISAYEGASFEDVDNAPIIVMEGFEVWVSQLIKMGKTDQEIVQYFHDKWSSLSSSQELILIMLEVGRGIVPINVHDRRLRDVMGWIQQDAVKMANKVTSIWHGLAKTMK